MDFFEVQFVFTTHIQSSNGTIGVTVWENGCSSKMFLRIRRSVICSISIGKLVGIPQATQLGF